MKKCNNCGFCGKPKSFTPGSMAVELALWLACLLPGVIYSIWRLSARFEACPQCKAPHMIPMR